MKKRPNWEIIYKAMLNGVEVKFPDGLTYTADDEGNLCLRLERIKPDDTREVIWSRYDMTFNQFIKECDQLPEETILGLGFSSAMKTMKNTTQTSKWDKE